MINRINLLLKAKNVTPKQFADEIGIQPSGMSHILSGRNNPSLDFVTKVLRRYPEIDANWLVLGIGEMYSASVNSPVAASQPSAPLPLPADTFNSSPTLFSDVSVTPSDNLAADLLTPLSNDIEESILNETNDEEPQPTSPEVDNRRQVTPASAIIDAPKGAVSRLLLLYDDNTFDILTPHQP